MKTLLTPALAAITATALLGACAGPGQYGPYGSQPYPATSTSTYPSNSTPYQLSYGVVESIQLMQPASGQASGAGAIIGGVVGGVLGNQVGRGTGRTAATVAGAVGGAIAGNAVENRGGAQRNRYQIGVRLDNGTYQTIVQDNLYDLQVGTRVRVENNTVYRY